MKVITIESSAFTALTEQIAEIAVYVRAVSGERKGESSDMLLTTREAAQYVGADVRPEKGDVEDVIIIARQYIARRVILRRFGIATTFVDPRDPDAWRAAVRPETRLLFGESLGNPGLDVLDIPTVAQIAHDARVPLA